jgi:putative DNA-invertase from lambdoid prophage Rac
MSVYGYVRVSTQQQADAGESLAVQQRQIQGYCHMHGLQLEGVFVERGISGSIAVTERPEGAALWAKIQRGDMVIAAKLDRLFRSALDALQTVAGLKEQGVSLVLLDLGGDISGNGLSKLFLTIAAAFAEAERDRIRERVTQTKMDQKARNRFLGGHKPFGYIVGDDGALAEDPIEQAAITKMVEMRQAGYPLRTITSLMAKDGFKLSHVGVGKIIAAALPR